MTKETQQTSTGATVRIWRGSLDRLVELKKAKAKKLKRPVSEVELVSKAVEDFCTKEERKLGIA